MNDKGIKAELDRATDVYEMEMSPSWAISSGNILTSAGYTTTDVTINKSN